MKINRSPREYRSLGIMLDRGRKPGGRRYDLTVSLWWWDLAVSLPVTGPVVPPGGEELREVLARRLYEADHGHGAWEDWLTAEDYERYMARAAVLAPENARPE